MRSWYSSFINTQPRLGTILVFVNAVVLFLPFLAIGALRIYDSELIRQTESSLIAQGAFVQTLYRNALIKEVGTQPYNFGVPFSPIEQLEIDGMTPVYPELDLAETAILPPARKAKRSENEPEPLSKNAGSRIITLLKEAQKITLCGIRVVNADGIVVASTRGEMLESLLHREEVQGALKGKVTRILRQRISDSPDPSLDSISRRTKVRIFLGMPIIYGKRVVGAVVLSRTPLSLQKALYKNRLLFLSFALIILFVAFFISILTAVTIGRPMKRLIVQMRALASGKSVEKVRNPRTREVEEMSQVFVDMAEKIEARSTYISNFARTVSHEFKTPISSIRASVEILLDHFDTMSTEERNDFLTLIDTESIRMQRLLNGLLELAKADMAQEEVEGIDLGIETQNIVKEYTKQDINITCDLEEDSQLLFPKEVFKSTLRNLLDNAIQAGAQNISLRSSREKSTLLLRIIDDGKGVPEADLENIFHAFFTTKRDTGGSGLGLAIVSSMLENFGASITLESTDEKGSVFLLRLPL